MACACLIDARPLAVGRTRIGDREGDLIVGRMNRSAETDSLLGVMSSLAVCVDGSSVD